MSDFDVNCKKNFLVIFSHANILLRKRGSRNERCCTARKRKKEMRAILGFNLKQWVTKRKCWTRDRESSCSSSRVCVISMLDSASTSWGIPQRSIALVLSLPSYTGHPRVPPGGDTVATFGFPLLPLCFTRVRWTAEFGVCGLVTVPSLLAKRRRPS